MKTRTKFVICSVINLIWFTLAVLALTWFDKMVPDSLIMAWFSSWTVELALLAGIKIKGKSEDVLDSLEEEYADESEE